MSGTVTWEVLIWLVGTIAAVVGFAFLVWWRIEGQVKSTGATSALRAEAAAIKSDQVDRDLQAYKTHVAEHYISMAGHREATEQVMGAISGLKSSIDGTNLRIDRMLDERPNRRATRQA